MARGKVTAKQAAAKSRAPTLATKKPRKSTASKKKAATSSHVKKPHRFRPGTVALREIRRLQKSTDSVFTRAFARFERLLREIVNETKLITEDGDGIKVSQHFVDAVRENLEAELVTLLEAANLAAIHAKRQTVMAKDIGLAQKINKLNLSQASRL